MGEVLPDVLGAGLGVVFCGTAAGAVSAARGAYYAGPGNRFYRTLHAVGLTPRVLRPEEYALLPTFGVGLTDLGKFASGSDAGLSAGDFDVAGLRAKIERVRPRVLCFNGKLAAKRWLEARMVGYGLLDSTVGATRVFVAPSTSGAANGYWDASYWHEVARLSRGEPGD